MDTADLFNSPQLTRIVPQKQIKMRQSEIAKILKVSRRTIIRWQNGDISFLGYIIMSLLHDKRLTVVDIEQLREKFDGTSSKPRATRVFGLDGFDQDGFDAEDFDRDGIERGHREQILRSRK